MVVQVLVMLLTVNRLAVHPTPQSELVIRMWGTGYMEKPLDHLLSIRFLV